MGRLNSIYSPESYIAQKNSIHLMDIWRHWNDEIHCDISQLVRQERATAGNYTPLTLDGEKGTATFRGTETDYYTSLLDCTCTDFKRHLLPCKHMYRLAYELDLFILDDVIEFPPTINIFNMSMFKNILQTIPKGQYELLYDIFSSDMPFYTQNTTAIQSLLKKHIIQLSENNEYYFSCLTKDELLSLIPDAHKKSSSKKQIISYIMDVCPESINDLKKYNVLVEPSMEIAHLEKSITSYLYQNM